jgi:hypothetical protein
MEAEGFLSEVRTEYCVQRSVCYIYVQLVAFEETKLRFQNVSVRICRHLFSTKTQNKLPVNPASIVRFEVLTAVLI